MAPAVTRTLKITYGSLYVGGDSAYEITGKVRYDQSYTAASVTFTVVVANTSASDLKTDCDTLEAAFRVPRQRLKIEMEGQTFKDFNPATGTNTGFLAAPSIEKRGDAVGDTGRSRVYDISVSVALPADMSGQSGRADSTITLDYDAARRRRITITGRYTALTSNNATAQYNAAIGTYASSVLSSLASGATFDLLSEDVIPDDADKNCSFARVYQEVLYAATSGSLGHASIRGASIAYTRRRPSPGDSRDRAVRRLEEVSVSFTCSVAQDVSTSLETLYGDSVRPYLLSQASTLFNATSTAVVDEVRSFDKTANTITATLDLRMVIAGTLHTEYRRTVSIEDDKGETLQPAWSGNSRYAKRRFDGIASRVRTITSVETVLGVWAVSADGSSFVGGGGGGGGNAAQGGAGAGGGIGAAPRPAAAIGVGVVGAEPIGGKGWVLMSTRRGFSTRKMGQDANTIDLTDLQTVIVEEYHDEPSGGGSGPVTTPSDPPVSGRFQSPGGSITPGAR